MSVVLNASEKTRKATASMDSLPADRLDVFAGKVTEAAEDRSVASFLPFSVAILPLR